MTKLGSSYTDPNAGQKPGISNIGSGESLPDLPNYDKNWTTEQVQNENQAYTRKLHDYLRRLVSSTVTAIAIGPGAGGGGAGSLKDWRWNATTKLFEVDRGSGFVVASGDQPVKVGQITREASGLGDAITPKYVKDTYVLSADTPEVLLWNTGEDSTPSALDGTADFHWGTASGPGYVVPDQAGWAASGVTYKWVSNTETAATGVGGNKLSVVIIDPRINLTNFTIPFQVAVDNQLDEVLVNGSNSVIAPKAVAAPAKGGLHSLSLDPADNFPWIPGVNILEFQTTDGTKNGLLVRWGTPTW